MSGLGVKVRRLAAPSGNRDNDYFRAECGSCGWVARGMHSNRTVEGRRLADRDAAGHLCGEDRSESDRA